MSDNSIVASAELGALREPIGARVGDPGVDEQATSSAGAAREGVLMGGDG